MNQIWKALKPEIINKALSRFSKKQNEVLNLNFDSE